MCATKVSVKKRSVKTPAADKPAKPRARRPCKSELLAEAAELLARIELAEEACQEARAAIEVRKEAYRTARSAYADRVEELRTLCRARKEEHPLFDQPAKKKGATKVADKKAADTKTADVQTNGNEPWRALPLAELKLSKRVTNALVDAGLTTIDELVRHMEKQGEWWAKQIKGLGEKGSETVCDALAAFWGDHPEYCTPATTTT